MSHGALLAILAQIRAGDYLPFALMPLFVPTSLDAPMPVRIKP